MSWHLFNASTCDLPQTGLKGLALKVTGGFIWCITPYSGPVLIFLSYFSYIQTFSCSNHTQMRLWGECGIAIVDHQCIQCTPKTGSNTALCCVYTTTTQVLLTAASHVVNQQMAGCNSVSWAVHSEWSALFIENKKQTKSSFQTQKYKFTTICTMSY